MAARNLTEGPRVFQRGDVVEVFGVFTGRADDGVLTKVAGHGVSSVTADVSECTYTVVLTDKYTALIGAQVTVVDPTPAATPTAHITSYDMSTKTVVIKTTNTADTPAAFVVPADGQLMFRLTLVNSSQPIK